MSLALLYISIIASAVLVYYSTFYYTGSTEIISTEEFAKCDSVGTAFIKLQTKLTKMLVKTDFMSLRRACIAQQRTPGGVQLPEQLETEIRHTQDTNMLLDTLIFSPYWSWIDIRILEAIVEASEISQALQILKNYKTAIFSRKVIELLPDAPSKEIKTKYFTKIGTKLGRNASKMTVEDLLKFQSQLETVIMDIGRGTCVLGHIRKGCIEVHWYIPTHCVDSAYQSASTRCYMFNEIHLLWLQIAHYPVIYDPVIYDPLTIPVNVSTPPPPDSTGKWYIQHVVYQLLACHLLVATVKDFIDHYYDYLSVNMDAEEVMQLMISQQLLSEHVVMAAQSSYQKACLILEQLRLIDVQALISFSKLLQENLSQRNILLLNGLLKTNCVYG